MNQHEKEIRKAIMSLESKKREVSQNHWRLAYHISAPAYWMNDPNGFCFYNGEYHLFYQHHPYSPEWGPMFWGHVKSKDLANWEQLPIALAPSEEYDIDGCFSGSAIEKDGKLYVMYTGNVWTGENHDQDLKQAQCLAVSDDGVNFKKLSQNPIISEAPAGDIHPFHFRDPKVWKKGDYFYCVLGSRTNDHNGQVLLYRSENLLEWKFINISAKSEGDLGYMWECPDFFQLDGQELLMMSPQGVKPDGHCYQNLHQSGYLAGQLDYETGVFSHGDFQMIDYGFDVYAPQTTVDSQGRRILIAWMAMWESDMPEQNYNWAGAMTLPRVLNWRNGQLISEPVPELEKLRYDEFSYEGIIVAGEKELEGISGSCIEVDLVIRPQLAEKFGVRLRESADSSEKTVLTVDLQSGLIEFDRNFSGAGPGGSRQAPIQLQNNELHLRIFIDHSSIEVFINGGEKVMTARIYPNEKSEGITFFSDKEMEIARLKKWKLNKAI